MLFGSSTVLPDEHAAATPTYGLANVMTACRSSTPRVNRFDTVAAAGAGAIAKPLSSPLVACDLGG